MPLHCARIVLGLQRRLGREPFNRQSRCPTSESEPSEIRTWDPLVKRPFPTLLELGTLVRSSCRSQRDARVVGHVGELGHLAIEYAKSMGLRAAAVDIAHDKLALAKRLDASIQQAMWCSTHPSITG